MVVLFSIRIISLSNDTNITILFPQKIKLWLDWLLAVVFTSIFSIFNCNHKFNVRYFKCRSLIFVVNAKKKLILIFLGFVFLSILKKEMDFFKKFHIKNNETIMKYDLSNVSIIFSFGFSQINQSWLHIFHNSLQGLSCNWMWFPGKYSNVPSPYIYM
jgi:hypothetical protein